MAKQITLAVGRILPQTDAEKEKALLDVQSTMAAKYSDPNIVTSLRATGEMMPSISTGVPELDYFVVGVGGWPKGRIIELFGPESGGKTTLALTALAEAQYAGGRVAFVDAEHALDPSWAARLGVDVDRLLISQPDYGEQALDVTEALVASGAIDALVVDSVAALVPKAELDGEMTDQHVGLQARMMAKAMRKLAAEVRATGTVVIFINQIREKIGVMFGNPETTPGGRALKHAASVRLRINRTGEPYQAKGEIAPTGHNISVKAVKNKVGPPLRKADFDLFYETGFDKGGSMAALAAGMGVVEKNGAFYSYKSERIGQGKEKAGLFLRDNPEVYEQIRVEVLNHLAAQRKAEIDALMARRQQRSITIEGN